MSKRIPGFIVWAAGAALAVSACGGGYDDVASSGGTGGTGVVFTGVMTKGSVIVDGVRFEDTAANIYVDDTLKSPADLRDGMVVRVNGRLNDDGIQGTAERVEAQIEARGVVTSVDGTANPQRFVVLGQTVIVDDLTVYSGVANFGGIAVSQLIEVHGLRDPGGNIRATRIEANQAQMGDDTVDEIRGVVSGGTGPNPMSFNIGAQPVSRASGAVIMPSGAVYQNGSVVEVHCVGSCLVAGVFQASRIEVEDAEDAPFQPGAGGRFDVEGLVSGFGGSPGSFLVAGTPVTTSASTAFRGGLSTDLANGIKVEAEGVWNGAALLASRIEFRRSVIRLQGATANRDTVANSFDLHIADNSYVVRIQLDSATSGALPADGLACVQVRGERMNPASPLVVRAGEIDTSCSNSGRHFIQAPVEAEAPMMMMTLLGFPLPVGNATGYRDMNGVSCSKMQFFDLVMPAGTNAVGVATPGTLVKVIFDDGLASVKEAEIED